MVISRALACLHPGRANDRCLSHDLILQASLAKPLLRQLHGTCSFPRLEAIPFAVGFSFAGPLVRNRIRHDLPMQLGDHSVKPQAEARQSRSWRAISAGTLRGRSVCKEARYRNRGRKADYQYARLGSGFLRQSSQPAQIASAAGRLPVYPSGSRPAARSPVAGGGSAR